MNFRSLVSSVVIFVFVFALILILVFPLALKAGDVEDIEALYDSAEAFAAAENLTGLMNLYHDDYLSGGRNKAYTTAWYSSLFADYSNIYVGNDLSDIVVNGDNATVTLTQSTFYGTHDETGEVHTQYSVGQAHLKKVSGNWKYYGNQEKYGLDAHSSHFEWSGWYGTSISIYDPLQQITALSVTGPGISGSLNLDDFVYNSSEGYWIKYGAIKTGDEVTPPPAPPLSYVFTITDGGGTYPPRTEIVESHFEPFASNLSPANDKPVSGVFSFSWTGVSTVNPVYYTIELYDSSDSLIWTSSPTAAETLKYSGPALSNGSDYYYYLCSWDKYGNDSLTYASFTYQSPGTVKSHQKISDTEGNFTGTLDNSDWFGFSVASVGDLDGDGVTDLAVGAGKDDDGDMDAGAVWVLFMNTNGTVKSHQKISDTEGNFTGTLDDSDFFGSSVASVGDLDGDGVTDLAVGAGKDDDGDMDAGAVWVLFMNTNGTVKSHQKISDTEGNFTGTLDSDVKFGCSVASIGDHDGDGVIDLAVGAYVDNDGGYGRGAVWVLFMNTNGTVKSHQKISDTEGNFTGTLDNHDNFGYSVASTGDLDGDCINDLAVGGFGDDDGGYGRGSVWILFMNTNGTVKSHQKISDTEGNFTGTLHDDDHFGYSVASTGDLDGDGVTDLAVGASGDDDGGSGRGAVWVLFMNTNGTVKSHQKISDTAGSFTGTLDNGDSLGESVASMGDLNGDGVTDLAVGARGDDDGGSGRGAVWILFMNGVASEAEFSKAMPWIYLLLLGD